MSESSPKAIGKRIKSTRLNREMSQMELATRVNISSNSISRWESGRYTPKPYMMGILSDVLNVSAIWLAYGDKPPKNSKVEVRKPERDDILTPALCRAARGMLHISQRDLAARAEIAVKTIADFESEKGRAMHISTLRALRQALEQMGIEFSRDEEGEYRIGRKSGRKKR